MESSVVASLRSLVGRRVTLPGHFAELVTTEDACPLGPGAELRVRLATGKLDEVGLLIAPAALPDLRLAVDRILPGRAGGDDARRTTP